MADIRHRRQGDPAWNILPDVALPLTLSGYALGEKVEVQSRDWSSSRLVEIAATVVAPAALGVLPDAALAAGQAFSIKTAGDFTGGPLSFSLVSAPAWMSIDPGTGLILGTAPGADSSSTVIVRASNGVGQADSGFSVLVSTIETITIDSASVAFPSANMNTGSALGEATYYRVPSPFVSPNGYFVNSLQTDMAMFLTLDIAWDKMSGDTPFGVFGNMSAGTNSQTWGGYVYGKDASSNAGNFVFSIFPSSGNKQSFALDLGAYANVSGRSKGTAVVWRSSSDASGLVQAAWFPADGSAAVGTVTLTSFVGGYSNYDMILGAMGTHNSSPMTPYEGATTLAGFTGMIRRFGVWAGDSTAANWQAIAAGADPVTTLTAGTVAQWRALYDFTDPTATSVSVTAGARADGARGPATLIVGDNGALAKGGDCLGAYDAGKIFAVDAVPDGFVWGRKPGDSTGKIKLSGTGSGLTGDIEIRCANVSDGQLVLDWTVATITSGSLAGAWAAEVDCPRNTGWGVIDVRPASATAMVQRIRQRCGVGTVALVFGQSQMNIATGVNRGVKTNYSNAGAISIARRNGGTASDPLQIIPMEQNTYQIADFFGGASDYLGRINAEPVLYIAEHINSTGINDLLDDALTGRAWSDFTALVTKSGGASNVTTTVLQWGTNFNSSSDIANSHLAPFYESVDPADASYTNDHGLSGYLDAGVVHAISPLTRDSNAGVTTSEIANQNNIAGCRAVEITYGLANSFAIGPFCNDYPTGDGDNHTFSPHSYSVTQESGSRLGERIFTAIMRAAGKDTTTNPSLGAVARSGASIAITPTLPNDGSVQTYWGFNSLTVPSGALDVSGFEVSEDSGSNWSYGESGTSIEFTTAISAGVVVLTRGAGNWAAGTRVRYLSGSPLSFGGLTAEEGNVRLRGVLYESGTQERGLGLPVAGSWTGTAT